MFSGLLGRRFYSKCKTSIKLTKTRLETIRKKRNAVQKFLKSDVADLLRNGHDYNAYGRVAGLLVEQNMSSCYDFVEQFCGCVSSHLSIMQKQRECPEECRESVSSLMYAAARFADLPELRELRSLFTERYTNSVEPYVNKEFVEKLGSKPPSKDMKLQLMHDIAQESSIEWDSKALEQKLFTPPAPEQDHRKYGSLHDTDDDGDKWNKTKDDGVSKTGNHYFGNKLNDVNDHTLPKRNGRDVTSHGRKDVTDDKYKLHSSSEDEVIAVHRRDSTDQDNQRYCSSSVGSVSEDEADNRRPFDYRFIPPPYTKPKAGNNESSSKRPRKSNGNVHAEEKDHQDVSVGEAKPKPRSVRTNKLKPPPGRNNVSSSESEGVEKANLEGTERENAKRGLQTRHVDGSDKRDEEERIMDGLLMHYSSKQPHYESGKVKAPLKPPPSRQAVDDGNVESARQRITKSELDAPPARAASLPTEATTPKEATKLHARASSLQPEMLAGHVHPKLPDYEELAAQFAALKGR